MLWLHSSRETSEAEVEKLIFWVGSLQSSEFLSSYSRPKIQGNQSNLTPGNAKGYRRIEIDNPIGREPETRWLSYLLYLLVAD